MPNGVIWGGAVDGSNHAGEIVTCQAMTTSPDGGAWLVASPTIPSVRVRPANADAMPRSRVMFASRGRSGERDVWCPECALVPLACQGRAGHTLTLGADLFIIRPEEETPWDRSSGSASP